MLRESVCLNGEWGFLPVYGGEEPGETIEAECTEKIRVPSSWRWKLTMIPEDLPEHRQYDLFGYPEEWNRADAGFIARRVRVQKRPGMRAVLRFNGILQRSRIYVNRRLVLESEEAFLPVAVDVTGLLAGDETELDVAVWCGPFRTVETANGPRHVAPDGTWFAWMARGIWQDVFLDYIPGTHIESSHAVTSVRRGEISMRAGVAGCAGIRVRIEAVVSCGGGVVKAFGSEEFLLNDAGRADIEFCSPWADATLWSPENPHLYELTLRLYAGGALADEKSSRFGFREAWAEGHIFYLNGIRINLLGDSWHYQGFAQQTKEYALNWFRLCRETGVNCVRLHGMPYPELYLEAADETGMLVIDESAIYGSAKYIQADHPDYLANCERHLKSLALRDRNHPCVLLYSMQNEMRWVDGREGYKQHIGRLMRIIRLLDDTRLISCDGDNRLLDEGTMEIVTMHYNIDGTVDSWDKKRPLFFGEHGKWHYISPQVASSHMGQAAYTSFDAALRDLGLEERMFLEYARKREVTCVSPFNMANYMMWTMPEQDEEISWEELASPGARPARIPAHSLCINNGLIRERACCALNASWEAVREGYRRVAVVADEYDSAFFGARRVVRNFSLYNDTMADQDASVEYRVERGDGSLLSSGSEAFCHRAGVRRSLAVEFAVPDTDAGETVALTVRLLHGGAARHVLEKRYRIHPSALKTEPVNMNGKTVAYVGGSDSLAVLSRVVRGIRALASIEELPQSGSSVLVIGSGFSGEASHVQPILDRFTANGGSVLVLEQKEFTLGDVSLSGRRHFKAFMTDGGHAVFAGLDGEDLGFWGSGNVNDPECGFLTENSFSKPTHGDFEILLECAEGDFGWGGLLWTPLLEYHAGNGILILSQLELTRCFEDVPAACILLRNLLNRCAGYTGRKQAAAALAYESEEFAAFFGAAGLDAARDGTPEAGGLLVAEPSSLKEKDVERLRSFVAEGGTLLLPAAEPEHAGLVGRIAGTAVRVEKNEAYQAAKCASDLLCGVSDHDLCLFERVTYSPTTKENALLCCCDVTAQGAEPLLSAVNAPWRSFFVDRLDAEPIKMSVAQRSGRGFTPALYGLALGMGRGRIILSQVRLLHNEKVIRYYSRLLANLGAGIRTGLLTYEKKPSDYAIPAMMSLAYDSKQDYDAQEQYFKGAGFKLNNLGEGLYGWMVRRERKNGWITVPGSAGQTWFLTVFIESRINRNPALREAGELPDSSIVPDLAVDVNCPFRLFVNGVLYADHADGLPETGQTEIRDVLLGKGINNLLLVCFGSLEDIRVTVALLGKSGHAVEGIRYLLTLD